MRCRIFLSKTGFSLIELMIVVTIIGILAAIAIPGYLGYQKKAARTEAFTNLENLRLLEEQFFAENGRYTISLGAAGDTTLIRNANLLAIQTNALPDRLARFLPGAATSFSYMIIQNNQLNAPVATPPVWAASPGGTLCFTAVATGIVGTRVAGDIFAIDCNNNRNF